MNPKMDDLIRQWIDGDISEADAADLLAEMGRDPELLREVKRQHRLHRMLGAQHDLDAFGARVSRSVAALQDQGGAERLARRIVVSVREEADAKKGADPAISGRLWRRVLALAASILVVVGGYLIISRQDGALGLRVAEVQRSEVGGQRSEVRGQSSGGKSVPAVQGMELRQGDRVAVKSGGKVGLKYDGEATKIDLMAATEATFGAEKGAKRVKLAAGMLVCSAAPQKQPFRLQTPHAVAEVVGTRFRLEAARNLTTLAVQEGKVALIAGEKRLEVKAGETATAGTDGLKALTRKEAWYAELLQRAETGPWDTLDFGKCNVIDQNDVWLVENRPGAERRFWNSTTGRVSSIFFDTARWKRGVFTARVMLLPTGVLSPELAPPSDAKRVEYVPMQDRRWVVPSPYDPSPVLLVRTYDKERMSLRYVDGSNTWSEVRAERGVWYRVATYVEEQEGGRHAIVVSLGVWREGDTPDIRRVVARGRSHAEERLRSNQAEDKIGLWLESFGAPLLVQGLKFVPVGTEMAGWLEMLGW